MCSGWGRIADSGRGHGSGSGQNFINNLPLINRSVLDLAYLAPGTAVPDHHAKPVPGPISSQRESNSTADS